MQIGRYEASHINPRLIVAMINYSPGCSPQRKMMLCLHNPPKQRPAQTPCSLYKTCLVLALK